jgi:voltage-gated potassium channel
MTIPETRQPPGTTPDGAPGGNPPREDTARRWALLDELAALLEGPLVLLAFVWLALLVIDLTTGLSGRLELAMYAVWGVFVADFLLRLVIAPDRLAYLRRNWLTALALVLPALRVVRTLSVLRFLRVARAVRSISLLRLVTSLNRSIGALRRTLARRGLAFVIAATVVVLVAGAAGIGYFESPAAVRDAGGSGGLATYADALWWTAMLLTTLGSDYWPQTGEGRVLTWSIALYAFVVFGYITASLASHFVRVDANVDEQGVRHVLPPARPLEIEMRELHAEMRALRKALEAERTARGLGDRNDRGGPEPDGGDT